MTASKRRLCWRRVDHGVLGETSGGAGSNRAFLPHPGCLDQQRSSRPPAGRNIEGAGLVGMGGGVRRREGTATHSPLDNGRRDSLRFDAWPPLQPDVGVPLRAQRGFSVVGGGADHRPYDPLQVPHAVSRALEGIVSAIGEIVVADGVDPLGRGGLRRNAGEGQCQPFAHLDRGTVGNSLERIGRPV